MRKAYVCHSVDTHGRMKPSGEMFLLTMRRVRCDICASTTPQSVTAINVATEENECILEAKGELMREMKGKDGRTEGPRE